MKSSPFIRSNKENTDRLKLGDINMELEMIHEPQSTDLKGKFLPKREQKGEPTTFGN